MNQRFFKWFCLLFVLLLLGCAKEEAPREVLSKTKLSEQNATETNAPSQNQPPVIQDRKIIKTGTIEFQTQNLSDVRQKIDNAIKRYNGYIANEQESSYNNRIQQHVVIRVPADNFDSLIKDISKGVKKFDEKRIDAQDITEEFLDITARLKIKKETEQRYRQLLARANTVKDILAIEKQIGELRADIESIEGRLKYLENQVSYSTLTVIFYEIISSPIGFGQKFKLGLLNGWNNFIWFLVGIVNIWPFILLVIGGLFSIRFYRKRRKK